VSSGMLKSATTVYRQCADGRYITADWHTFFQENRMNVIQSTRIASDLVNPVWVKVLGPLRPVLTASTAARPSPFWSQS